MFLNGAPDADYEADPARFFALFMAFATELDAAHAHVIAADAKVFNSHFCLHDCTLLTGTCEAMIFGNTDPSGSHLPCSCVGADASIAHARRDPDVW